jgi:FMN phosphatase YigB (HAD superfamily)
MPERVFIFDLDLTLLDTSAVDSLRKAQLWNEVRSNLHLVRADRSPAQGTARALKV